MKKFVCGLLVLVCMLGCLGCNAKEPEYNFYSTPFQDVMSISYISDNGKQYLFSSVYLTYKEPTEIAMEEYYKFEQTHQFSRDPKKNIGISRDKSNLSAWTVDKYVGCTAYGTIPYTKFQIETVEVRYISVKIIDNRALLIKTHNENITYITADYFNIEYFM